MTQFFESAPTVRTVAALELRITKVENDLEFLQYAPSMRVKAGIILLFQFIFSRYELFCLSKSVKTTQCTVALPVNVERAWSINLKRGDDEQYSRETFDALILRWEVFFHPHLCVTQRSSWLHRYLHDGLGL